MDKFLVATAFDWVDRRKPNTNLTVCQDVEVAGRGGAGRRGGEDPLEGMVEGAELTRVACGPEGAHPRSIGTVGDYRAQMSTIESAWWWQMWTPQPAVPKALDAEPSVNKVAVGSGRGDDPGSPLTVRSVPPSVVS